jgi:hypothetical protein
MRHPIQEHFCQAFSYLLGEGPNRGQRRVEEGGVDVVEARDRDILGDLQMAVTQSPINALGN